MYQVTTYIQENYQMVSKFKMMANYLWIDHIIYTRNAVISIPSKLDDATDVVGRLMKNQEDIGMIIIPYYDEADVMNMIAILKEHIRIAGNIALADPNDTTDWQALWEENGNSFISLMQTMNPYYWPPNITKPLWDSHMKYVNDQISFRASKEWSKDIDAFDDNHRTIVKFANVFANGTIYKAMDKFSTVIIDQGYDYGQP